MAKRSGVSRAMIHRVETGRSSPTAVLLGKIAGALQLSVPFLLREEPSQPEQRLRRSHERTPWHDPKTGYIREQINVVSENDRGSPNDPQVTRVTLPPHQKVSYPPTIFEFVSQVIWVLEGTLHFTEGGTVHELEKDDCLTLGLASQCAFENRSDEDCVYVVVVT
jgi:transcriptional regulator with XRE-family HTH domain